MKIEEVRRPWSKKVNQGATYTDTSFYRTTTWRNNRKAFMMKFPNCVECGREGDMVDHKLRIEAGGDKMDWSNLQTMCNRCHNVKRANEKNAKYSKK